MSRCHYQVDYAQIVKNYKACKKSYGGQIIPVIKGECYNTDSLKVIDMLRAESKMFCTATLQEAKKGLKAFPDTNYWVLSPITLEDLATTIPKEIGITIPSLEYAKITKNKTVYLAINTGMNRIGISTLEELDQEIKILENNKCWIKGIYTHYPSGIDKQESDANFKKYLEFYYFIKKLYPSIESSCDTSPRVCSGIKITPELSYARVGTALAIKEDCFTIQGLADCVSFSTSVTSVIPINKNQTAGYHSYNNYKTLEKGYLFVVPVGFADCLPVSFHGKCYNHRTKKWYDIAGRPCMDQTIFFTPDNDVKLGDKISFGTVAQISNASGDKTSPPEIQQNFKRVQED